jgi:hypothetical protein
MVEILGKNYFINVDGITQTCQTGNEVKNEDGTTTFEINLFKYEIIKSCVERILSEFAEVDNELGPFAENGLTISFKIAFNTLIKYDILIPEDE